MVLLHADELDVKLVRETLNILLKFEEDIAATAPSINERVSKSAQTPREIRRVATT